MNGDNTSSQVIAGFNLRTSLNTILIKIATPEEEIEKTLESYKRLAAKRITKALLEKLENNPSLKDLILSLNEDTDAASISNDIKRLFEYCETNLSPDDKALVYYGSMISSFLDVLQTVIDTSTQEDKVKIAKTLSEDETFNQLYQEWKNLNPK